MNAIKCMFLLSIAVGSAWCCPVNAVNIEGVAFTSDEIINLDKFEALGTQNVNISLSGIESTGIYYLNIYNAINKVSAPVLILK